MGMREKLIELLEECDILKLCTIDLEGNCPSSCEHIDVPDCGKSRLAQYLIANGVTIPVRCKDCKWWKDWYCTNVNGANTSIVNGDWYCCAGERRTDDST